MDAKTKKRATIYVVALLLLIGFSTWAWSISPSHRPTPVPKPAHVSCVGDRDNDCAREPNG